MRSEHISEPSLRQIMIAVINLTKSYWLKPHIDEFVELYADYVKGYRGKEIISGICYHMSTFGKVPMPDEISPAIEQVKRLGLELPLLPQLH